MASVIRAIKQDVANVKAQVQGSSTYGPVASFFTFFQGRATTFGILFAAVSLVLTGVAIWGFIHGRDLGSLASFALAVAALNGSIQAMVVAHSCKEDWATIKQQAITQQVVMTTPPTPPTPPNTTVSAQ
jgi:hypothetical protein